MNTDFEGRIFEPKSRPAGASVETNLLRLSLGTLAVFAVLLGAFFWVERRLATSLGMNETVVVPARDVAGGIDEALGQLLVRQSRLAGASSSASLEALADRSQAEARLNEVRGHVGGVAESLRKAGASEIPHDFASTFDETFEGFLEADARFLSATQVQHRSAERLDAEIRSVEKDLKVFLESANGLSGKMRFGYGSSLRRLRRELAAQGWTPRVREALREEVMDSSNRRSRVVGDVLGLASELNRLAGKVGLTSNRDQLRSLVANELVPTRDRLIVALEELRHEVHGDEELLPIVDRLDASTAGLSIRILSKDGESLVALKRSLLTAQLEGAEVQTRLAQLAGEATKLSEALLTAAESESRGFDDGLRSAGSTTRWLLLAVMIVAGLGGVLGFRSVRASVKSLRATNEDLVRLKDELTELNQGLEAKVAERTAALDAGNRAMRLVLDNVEQGLVTLDPKGRLQTQRSARFDEWFGAQAEGTGFGQVISGRDEKAGAFFHIAWDEVEEGIMPLDVNLSQLPHRVKVGGATLHLDYRCISKLSDDVPDQTLVMVSDITQQLERERAEAAEREFASVFRHLMKDRSSFLDFFTEAASIVGRIEDAAAQDPKELFRAIHTLKGNCAIYGLERMAQLCHEIETAMVDESRGPSENERRSVTGLWRELSHKVGSLIDDGGQQRINVQRAELESLIHQARSGEELLSTLESWRGEPVGGRLDRLAEQGKSLARRLGKGDCEFEVLGGDVRLPRERFSAFWASLAHVVRNAVDHGLETPDERIASGKEPRGGVELRVESTPSGGVRVVVCDDGRGVDWERVKRKAESRGLPTHGPDDLVQALFADGLTTRDEVTTTSGRGVGMSAVKAAVSRLGGRVDVVGAVGEGTSFEFTFPPDAVADSPPLEKRTHSMTGSIDLATPPA